MCLDCGIVDYDRSACFRCKHDTWFRHPEGEWDWRCAIGESDVPVKTCPKFEPKGFVRADKLLVEEADA